MQVQTSETTVFDREKNELLTDRKMTLSAPNTSDKQLLTQSYLSDGALYHKLNGSWSAELVTVAEQEGLAAMYGRVPLVYIDSLQEKNGNWIVSCIRKVSEGTGRWSTSYHALPNAYTELLWSIEAAVDDLKEDVLRTPVIEVQQNVSGGLIHTQSVTANLLLGGDMYATPTMVSTLDKTGADAVLNAPR